MGIKFKVGDKVRAKIWPESITGNVVKVLGRAIFIDSYDNAGRALCVQDTVCSLIPGPQSLEYAVRLH